MSTWSQMFSEYKIVEAKLGPMRGSPAPEGFYFAGLSMDMPNRLMRTLYVKPNPACLTVGFPVGKIGSFDMIANGTKECHVVRLFVGDMELIDKTEISGDLQWIPIEVLEFVDRKGLRK